MFKLNIECTKDIDELHINFSDGSSVVTTVPSNDKQESKEKPKQKQAKRTSNVSSKVQKQEAFLDLDADFGSVSQDVVKPPEIVREERPVKVAEELQNFDF